MKHIAIGLVLVVACKKHDAPVATGSGSGSAVAVVPDAPAAPWAFPASPAKLAGTKASPEAEEIVDATAAGPAVALRFVQKITDNPHDGGIEAPLSLLLESGGKAWIYDATAEYPPADGDKAHAKLPKGTQLVLPPLPAPRLFAEADSITRLRPRKPMLYLAHFKTDGDEGIANDYAILHDGDALKVWRMTAANASIDVPPAWSLIASLQLAKGAVVTPFGPTGAPASTTPAPPPPRTTTPVAAGSLDKSIAGIYEGQKILTRVDTKFSQWGVTADADHALTVHRSTSSGNSATQLKLESPTAVIDAVTKIDVRDVDGDDVDDATITATWHDGAKHGEQLFVLGGADAAMEIGASYAAGAPAPADDAIDFTPPP